MGRDEEIIGMMSLLLALIVEAASAGIESVSFGPAVVGVLVIAAGTAGDEEGME